MALTAVVALLAIGAGWFVLAQNRRERLRAATELDIVARYKADSIGSWRQRRLTDAAVAARSDEWRAAVEAYLRRPGADTRGELSRRLMGLVRHATGLRAQLVDEQAHLLIAEPAADTTVSGATVAVLASALASGQPALTDPDGVGDGLWCELVVPLTGSVAGQAAKHAIVLRLSVADTLGAIVRAWPTAARTASTSLVRRGGPNADCLVVSGGPQPVEWPGSRLDLPEVRAIGGERGPLPARAFFDRRAVGAVRDVPDSDWLVVTSISAGEALAGWRRQSALLGVMLFLLVAALAATSGLVWQQQGRYGEVAEREERFRRLFEDSAECMLLIEGDRFVDANPAALALLGASSRAEVVGRGPADLSPELQPDGQRSLDKVAPLLEQAIERGSLSFEWEHLRLDGTPFQVEVLLTPMVHRQRRLVFCTWRDIGPRKEAEERLRDSLALNQRLLEASLFGVLVYRADGQCLSANEAAARLAGGSVEQMVAQNFHQVPSWQASGLAAAAEEVLAGGQPRQMEVSLETSFGRQVVLDCNLSRFELRGQPHLLVTVLDVTEARQAQALHQRLAGIVEATSDFVAMRVPDGPTVYLNATARRWHGLGEDDDPQQIRRDRIQPEWVRRLIEEEGIPTAMRDGVWAGETAMLDANGREVPHSQVILAHRGADGQVAMLSTIARDISGQRRDEALAAARLRLLAAAEGADLDTFLQAALDELEAITASAIGFYHFVEADQEHLVLQTWSTNTLAEMCTAQGKGSHYALSQAGVWADCARLRQPVVHNDFAQVAHPGGLPPGHAPVTREITVPVLRGDQVVAIVGVGNRAAPYNDDDVAAVQLLADFSYEVVERLRAERARAEGEARLREVTAHVPCILTSGIIEADEDWVSRALDTTPEGSPYQWHDFRVINEGMAQTLLPLALAQGETYYDAWRLSRDVDDQRRANLSVGTALLNGEVSYTNEWRCTDCRGQLHWQRQRVMVEPLGERRWRVFGVTTDITDNRLAEEARAEGEQRLRQVTGSVPCILTSGVVEADEGWRERALDVVAVPFRWRNVHLINEETAQALLPLDVAAGRTYYRTWVTSRWPEDQTQANLRAGRAFLEGLAGWRNEWRCTDRHGVVHWQQQEVTIAPLAEGRWQVFGVTIDITDLKLAEEARAAGERRLREVTSRLPCVLTTTLVEARPGWQELLAVGRIREIEMDRVEGTVLDIDAAQRMLPLDVPDGGDYIEAWIDARDPADNLAGGEVMKAALLAGELRYHVGFRSTDRFGQHHWLHQDVTVDAVDEGRWRLFAVTTDVTTVRQTEEARAAGEELMRHVTANVPCILSSGVVEADEGWREAALQPHPDTYPFRWPNAKVLNEEAAQRLLPLEIPAGRDYYHAWRWSRDAADQWQASVVAAQAFVLGLPRYGNDWRCVDRWGHEHWQHQDVSVQPIGEGRWHVFGVATDVTELKLVEAARLAGEELLQRVTRHVPCILSSAIVEADEDWREVPLDDLEPGRPFHWTEMRVLNEAAAQEILPLDVPEGGTYYTAWRDARDPEARREARAIAARAFFEGDGAYINEWRCTDRFGQSHWQKQIATVQPAGERLWHVFSITTDITDLKRAQAEQSELLAELARSNAELEQFAYVASHDLQEPLRLVGAYTDLLMQRYRDRLDADAEPLVGFITDGVTRMQRLVQDLLLYSRISTRGAPMSRVRLDVPVDEALANLALTIAETGAEITRDALPEMLADGQQLVQLYQNLIGNALKFRRAGETPRIHLGAERDEQGWRLWVADNGIGIEPAYFERIFVIFQRLHTRRQYTGTGIGLAVCKRIVERHGGRIWVESVGPERPGSTFFFVLPDEPARGTDHEAEEQGPDDRG